jgi:hypothetical protein
MRYRLLIEYEDGTYRVREDTLDELRDYVPEPGEYCTLTRVVYEG